MKLESKLVYFHVCNDHSLELIPESEEKPDLINMEWDWDYDHNGRSYFEDEEEGPIYLVKAIIREVK